jgi:hypothetical protein
MTQTQHSDHNPALQTIGWREWLALPGLDIPAIKAKIDTGARTSALHAFQLETFRRHGRKHVRFLLHPLRRRDDIVLSCTAPVIDERIVTDSGGHREQRYVISTAARLGEHEWPLELTLTDRENMLFRMLLGRTALEGRFVIDPQTSYRCGRRLRKAYNRARLPAQSQINTTLCAHKGVE